MPCRIVPADAKGHFPTAAPAAPPMGLSPRMQGAHSILVLGRIDGRIISRESNNPLQTILMFKP